MRQPRPRGAWWSSRATGFAQCRGRSAATRTTPGPPAIANARRQSMPTPTRRKRRDRAMILHGYPALGKRALTLEAWGANRGRLLLSVAGVALGVALGVAVHLINSSAIHQFTQAARELSGDADLAVRGTGAGFDESLYPKIRAL